jgi:hypothetical protein
MKTFKNLSIGAVMATLLLLSTSARASFTFGDYELSQVGPAQPGDSWTATWVLNGIGFGTTFNKIVGTIVSGTDTFESNLTTPSGPGGLYATGWTTSNPNLTQSSIIGTSVSSLTFYTDFTGNSTDTPYVTLYFQAFGSDGSSATSGLLRNDASGHFTPVPVPEPTTLIAGALLLLPFGASTLRFLRKQRVA